MPELLKAAMIGCLVAGVLLGTVAAHGRTPSNQAEHAMPDDEPKQAPKPRDLTVTRTFDASVEAVWKAWSDAEQVKRWWGPTGFTCPVAKMDFRVGGTSLVCMRAPKEFGGQEMYSTWAYKAIDPLKRIEYDHNLSDKDGKPIDPTTVGLTADFPQNQRHVVTFKRLGDRKTEMTMIEYGYTSDKWYDLSKAGLNQCLDKMAATFAKP